MVEPDIVGFEKVDRIPARRGSKYRTLVNELKQMPNQWVRLQKPYKAATEASSVVNNLKSYYGLEASARTSDNETYHVYARYVPQLQSKNDKASL